MTRPNPKYVTIKTGPPVVVALLQDLFSEPRKAVVKWSRITGQTAQVRLAYPGQHLASVVTGVRGQGTAARGNDLADGSEVKTCSRADQLGSCKICEAPVLPYEKLCPQCGSASIRRKTDSHWILSVKTEGELAQYLSAPRIVLVLFDRSGEAASAVRVRVWEVWPSAARHAHFGWFVTDYFRNNYQKKLEQSLQPAPLNLHPLKFDFFMMNPALVFDAEIADADQENSRVAVNFLAHPLEDRATLQAEPMPATVLTRAERMALVEALADDEAISSYAEGHISPKDVAMLRTTPAGLDRLAKELVVLDERARTLLARSDKRIKLTPPPDYKRRRPSE